MFRWLHWVALTAVVAFMLVARWLDDEEQPRAASSGVVDRTASTGRPFDTH